MIPRRGGILLEVLFSIALFVGAATFALGAARTVLGVLDRGHRESVAVDYARSLMAELESGRLALAELREGSVARLGSFDELDDPDARRGAPRWTVDVRSERTEYDGLTLVVLTVREEDDEDADGRDAASYTLRQLVRLRDDAEETFETDDLLDGLDAEGAAP